MWGGGESLTEAKAGCLLMAGRAARASTVGFSTAVVHLIHKALCSVQLALHTRAQAFGPSTTAGRCISPWQKQWRWRSQWLCLHSQHRRWLELQGKGAQAVQVTAAQRAHFEKAGQLLKAERQVAKPHGLACCGCSGNVATVSLQVHRAGAWLHECMSVQAWMAAHKQASMPADAVGHATVAYRCICRRDCSRAGTGCACNGRREGLHWSEGVDGRAPSCVSRRGMKSAEAQASDPKHGSTASRHLFKAKHQLGMATVQPICLRAVLRGHLGLCIGHGCGCSEGKEVRRVVGSRVQRLLPPARACNQRVQLSRVPATSLKKCGSVCF